MTTEQWSTVLVSGFVERLPDQRTADWPLVDFRQSLGLAALYCLLVFALPRLLKAKEGRTQSLRGVRLCYNAFMVLFNLYLVVEMIHQATLTSWFGPITPGEQGLGVCTESALCSPTAI